MKILRTAVLALILQQIMLSGLHVVPALASPGGGTAVRAKIRMASAEQSYKIGNYNAVSKILSNPTTADECVLLARSLAASTVGGSALYYSKAADLTADESRKLFYQGMARMASTDFDHAATILSQANQEAPNDIEIQSEFGRALFKIGSTERGLDLMQKALASSPNSVFCLENLAFAYTHAFDASKAIEYYTRLIKVQPGSVTPLLQRAFIYSENGKITSAMSDFDSALRINPDCQLAYYKRCTVWRNQSNFKKAIADGDRCMACKDSIPVINRRAQRIKIDAETRLHNYGAASAQSEALTGKSGTKSAISYGTRGDILKRIALMERAGQFSDALKIMEPLYRSNPHRTEFMVTYARLLGEVGDFRGSLVVCNKLIELDTNMADWFAMRAKAYAGLKDVVSARRDSEKAKALRAEFTDLPDHYVDSMR